MRIKKGDIYPFEYQLRWDDGEAISLTAASKVEFFLTLDGDTDPTVEGECDITDAANGKVKYTWVDGDTDEIGMYLAEYRITFTDGSILTIPSDDELWILIIDSLG